VISRASSIRCATESWIDREDEAEIDIRAVRDRKSAAKGASKRGGASSSLPGVPRTKFSIQ
jgi:hypothetical protein